MRKLYVYKVEIVNENYNETKKSSFTSLLLNHPLGIPNSVLQSLKTRKLALVLLKLDPNNMPT